MGTDLFVAGGAGAIASAGVNDIHHLGAVPAESTSTYIDTWSACIPTMRRVRAP